MKKSKRIISFAVSLIVLICTLSIPAYAAEKNVTLSVSTVTGVPLDNITVNVNMDINPGIMAMTFAVAYDSTALTFKSYNEGGLYSDYTISDHPESGYVSFVNCESNNKKYVGLIFSIDFEIKETAKPDFYPITIKNIRPDTYGDSLKGCFADWSGNTITATVTNGGVTVGKNCLNSGHVYDEWKTTTKPTCEKEGVLSHSCIKCGHIESKPINATGHDFEDFWTIDREASFGISGIMSRHCKNCGAVTDKTIFSAPDVSNNNFENKVDTKVTENDFDKLKKTDDTETVIPEESNTPQVKQPSVPQTNDNAKSADEILEIMKKADSIPLRIYRYIFGNDGKSGVLSKVIKVFTKFNSENKWNVIFFPSILGMLLVFI